MFFVVWVPPAYSQAYVSSKLFMYNRDSTHTLYNEVEGDKNISFFIISGATETDTIMSSSPINLCWKMMFLQRNYILFLIYSY